MIKLALESTHQTATLLSLILSFCMVVSNRKIVNSNIFTSTSAMSNPVKSKTSFEDILMGALRGRSIVSSTNSSRESFILFKVSRLKKVDLIYFIFIFNLFFHFLFLEQLGLWLIGHSFISVTT